MNKEEVFAKVWSAAAVNDLEAALDDILRQTEQRRRAEAVIRSMREAIRTYIGLKFGRVEDAVAFNESIFLMKLESAPIRESAAAMIDRFYVRLKRHVDTITAGKGAIKPEGFRRGYVGGGMKVHTISPDGSPVCGNGVFMGSRGIRVGYTDSPVTCKQCQQIAKTAPLVPSSAEERKSA